ncbi:MAG: colicin V production CvpA [endosymbiont of Galathealinum brachiosum]|uniref:Colicin V production CvpA n=1 Tax=endosymbiont of Galathealinum brachiosum TaxID=2200906 RepID=A0A370DIU6_9GAMM|nr:MAG: colicin V production CvpA [endosymbiont of Galathealinum brachiosum]
MTLVDFGIVTIIAVLLVLGLVWGFVKIAIALGTWLAASTISFSFAPNLAASMLTSIDSPPMRLAAAMGILFVLTIMVGAVVSFLVRQFVSKTGLSGLDRVLGLVIGGSLGLLIVIALVFIAGLTNAPSYDWWQSSLLIERFETLAMSLQAYLPDDVAKYFSY